MIGHQEACNLGYEFSLLPRVFDDAPGDLRIYRIVYRPSHEVLGYGEGMDDALDIVDMHREQ